MGQIKTLDYSEQGAFNGKIYVTLTDAFINSTLNKDNLKKDVVYKINAFSNQSCVFNIQIGSNYITSVYEYSAIKEIIRDKDKIAECEKAVYKEAEERIELYRKKGKLVHPSDILQIVNDIFGEDRVYIKESDISNFFNNYKYDIYIHFPVINITNSRKDHHVIKDLYVRFHILSSSSLADLSIIVSGTRLTISLREWESNYGHSHFSGRSPASFSDFCLGSSDFSRLIMDTKIEKTEDCWNLMFMSLENYLKWESIEGGPYRYINSIEYSRSFNGETGAPHLAKIISGIDKSRWNYLNNKLALKDSDDLYDYFDKHSELRSNSGYSQQELEHSIKSINKDLYRNTLDWKGEVLRAKVYDDSNPQSHVKLDPSVVALYHRVISEQFDLFNLKKTHNEYKQRNHKKIFGEVSSFQQA